MSESPLLVVKPVPVLKQFWLVGGIQSAGVALSVGLLALAPLKFGADAATGSTGETNLPFALLWASTASGAAFLAAWAFHYKKLVKDRFDTTYAVYADRIESTRRGRSRAVVTVPLDRVVDVRSSAGRVSRAAGLATVTVVADQPPGRSGPRGRLWTPFPNVPDAEAFRALVRSLISAADGSA